MTRAETIVALEKLVADSRTLLDDVRKVNDAIRESKLPITGIDVMGVWDCQRSAETMLLEMRLRAAAAA